MPTFKRKIIMTKRFVSFLTFLLFSIIVSAQDFEVSPVSMSFSVEPGQVGTKTLTVKNYDSQKGSFSLTLGDMQRDSTGKGKRLAAGTSSRSCANWITLNPSFFDLNPNESKEVVVTLKVPISESSSKWALIYVKSVHEQTSQGAEKVTATGIRVSPRITVQVYQSPSSNSNFKASIANLKEVTTAKDTVRKFSSFLKNTGDKKVTAKVQLVISNVETMKEKKYHPFRYCCFRVKAKR